MLAIGTTTPEAEKIAAGVIMNYQSEEEMYPDVVRWLKSFLAGKHPESDVFAYDTHKVNLSSFLPGKGFTNRDFPAYEIKVDVTGIIRRGTSEKLAFVECKLNPIRLIDVAQIIGYSRVAEPEYSFIISPEGANDGVNRLFKTFKKYKVLNYDSSHSVVIARWDGTRTDIDYMTMIPGGWV